MIPAMVVLWLANLLLLAASGAEYVRDLEVSEGVPVGTRIGFIGDGTSPDSGPPYLIVPVGSAVDTDLTVDQTTGEIRTKVQLDREKRASYSLVAIPMGGDNVRVVVKVLDENDNAPTFPSHLVNIEFPENTPRDVKRTLPPARDLDLDVYNTQRYNIVSGNVNNAFRLSSHRERDGVLYLDLQINGFLDRETTAAYSLVIEALDGGSPPLRGEMTVNITIQDVNDNPPLFNQSRYFAIVPENSTVGTNVVQVYATDADEDENGAVEYAINRRQSDRDMMFRIDATTGMIAVNKPLDFETKELHELVIVAKDRGLQPLETTAFVSIRVTDVNDNQPTINVIFLSEDATPKISESAQPGEFVARISVHDPDSKTDYSNVNVTLNGGDGHFGLTTRDNIIYLVIVSLPLDRETKSNYTLNVEATDTGTPPLHASKIINLRVTDINDNAPEFDRDVYEVNVMEVSDPGTSVVQVLATDRDEGNNSVIRYSLAELSNTHSRWFQIDSSSGLITTRAHVDCETEPVPKLTVVATDNGFPPLSSSATVLVTIHDVNDNEPIFDQSFYNVSVAENEPEGSCILKVSASDPDCGVNAMVNYTLGDGFGKLKNFKVQSDTGEVCISSSLDYETRNIYEFPVIATDRGGLSTTAMVKVQITDVNDNSPVFYPPQYNVSLREGPGLSFSTPVVVLSATDPDSGTFGMVTYKIVAGNGAGLFRIDQNTGEIFLSRSTAKSAGIKPYYRLNVSASDGGNLKSLRDAEVFISIIDSAQRPPIFEHPRYMYSVSESVKKETIVGYVKATVNDKVGGFNIRYSIYSGDPDGFFRIDPISGAIKVANILDHECRASVLLNVQATSGNPPVYGHTQVNIEIEDINDNAPEFDSNTVRISVPENIEIGVPMYAAHAKDKDSGLNGDVRYKILNSAASGNFFKIDPHLGHLTVIKHLDYETVQRHTLIVSATDMGDPPLSANLTVLVEVQDVNDNPPVFERHDYTVKVSESEPVNSKILQLTAVDADTGNNARITYRVHPSNKSNDIGDIFGIFPNSGWLYLKTSINREIKDHYELSVVATDNGTPTESAFTKVYVIVLDDNDNDPIFSKEIYEFTVEENIRKGAFVGKIVATDEDKGLNGSVTYSLVPNNSSSFQINSITGEITTKEQLDREVKERYDLVAEARDQGTPSRSTRTIIKILVLDVNDNSPEIIDPQEDIVSVREGQPPGTEVARVRAIDADKGYNSSITYSIIKAHDADGNDVFDINSITGIIKTQNILDHEEKTIYRLAVAATDGGSPPKQSIRYLRVEVLDLSDNRPTFTSSSLVFRVKEDVKVGHVVGSVANASPDNQENLINSNLAVHITYTLISLSPDPTTTAFEIDRNTGSLVVAQELDRESQPEYRFEIRALDTTAVNNPQSSAITVRVEIEDVNDNRPKWPQDLITIRISENTEIGSVLYNFTAYDADSGSNGEIRYSVCTQFPDRDTFTIDSLTGMLILSSKVDFEKVQEYTIIIRATDQSSNIQERYSTSVTARIIINDYNDNAPRFIYPPTSSITLSESITVGMTVSRVIAVDDDSGDNARVTYIVSGSNEDSLFSLGYDTGILTLTKPLKANQKFYVLNLTATDHGTPTKHANMELKIWVRGADNNLPKFLNSYYDATIAENAPSETVVTTVAAKSGHSRHGANITFLMNSELTDDAFQMTSDGVVITKTILDREYRDEYCVPIYVTDSSTNDETLFDMTKLIIKVTDVNDNAPIFQSGSCYPLSVPENSDAAVIHTVVARDLDSGVNGDISYSISRGNTGSKFSLDTKTGELTAKSLDRESHARYHLTITAQDHGTPPLQTSCNITVSVEDQNDNDPKFDLSRYFTEIFEDIPIDTSILQVHATDPDIGLNSRIIYYLANESQWLFRIDNKTGIITTAGVFDRERQSIYNFFVMATDSGKYNARSSKVPVSVSIKDVNDNKPIFVNYPFRQQLSAYNQPGHAILKVSATDADEGINSDIVYSIINDGSFGKFRINPNTGILIATESLTASSGKMIYINILATDKGNPPKSSIGLVELLVGDVSQDIPTLRFQNDTYEVAIPENIEQFRDVLQVSAVRSDGRRQRIIYSFGKGNEENIFIINSENGMIQIREPKYLDYELHKEISLIVEATTDGTSNLHGYCKVLIKLTDENDNAPKFTQQQYTASVWEGNKKGAFVTEFVAYDMDEGPNSRIRYHIVDGNHDNAFKIEPAFSGTLKTNIVLDREIRDKYRLTVIATDEGVPQMTGTTRIQINVVDVNDNQPTFPPHSIITVKEDVAVGTVLTTVTANDVDTYPALTYSFSPDTQAEYFKIFSIDRFSGKVTLKSNLDHETWQEYTLKILASDTLHVAETTLTIKIIDINDNPPIFSEVVYEGSLSDVQSSGQVEILSVNASDADSGINAKIKYSLPNPPSGFSIGADNGILKVNLSNVSLIMKDIDFLVKAEDGGEIPLYSYASVRIKLAGVPSQGQTYKKHYNLSIPENTPRGSSIINLGKPGKENRENYDIKSDDEGVFEVSNPSGALILVKKLDRESRDNYDFKISSNNFIIDIHIHVDDSNDNYPMFKNSEYSKNISESASIGSVVEKITATDADLPKTPNSEIVYDITSGNDDGCFRIEKTTGTIYVNKTLDFDVGNVDYRLIIRACDNGIPPMCAFSKFLVTLQDENDNIPLFPVSEYLEYVTENEPIGTVVFRAQATDLDKGQYGSLNYSIINAGKYVGIGNPENFFHIDSVTGLVTTNAIFDFEQRNRYGFIIKAADVGDKYSTVKVRVEIEGKDEFHPQFTERSYRFVLATSVPLPIGYVIGHVLATDRDKGPDGRVIYYLTTQNSYFKINRTTGDLILKRKLDKFDVIGREISLVVTASSGRQGSLTNMTIVEIVFDPLADPATNLGINSGNNTTVNTSISDWALGLMISIILIIITFGAVLVFLHLRNKRNRKINKPNLSSQSLPTSNNYVDPSSFDTIPIRGGVAHAVPQNQFAPPKYDEIPPYVAGHAASSNSGAATTSELSGSEQSGSSGRGSAEEGEDGEDEEIRMINEGPLQRDNGLHRQDDEDNLSDVSVKNTQEYLARLGIVNMGGNHVQNVGRLCSDARGSSGKETLHNHQAVPLDSLQMFDEEANNENDITNLIYAKLNEVSGSDRASSTDEGAAVGTSNLAATMDHVMAIGGYGEVPAVSHQLSMNGSLSSIVHSEEELAGSYNWDYLLDWGPQYQPLAHVFSEIARLKDDTASVHSGASGTSSVRSKNSTLPIKSIPPPLITSVAPRSITMPVLNSRGGSSHHGTMGHTQMMMLPRSPINHDASGATFSTSTAMSPSFSPSLSPLATKSPSISPLVAPGLSTAQHVMSRQAQNRNKTVVDTELRI